VNRRKAIGRLALAGVGAGLAFGGYKWYDWTKTPDLHYLEENKELVATLAETIIPATDTPGAKEAGVGDYIVIMIRDCTDRMSTNKFIDGLKDLQHYCRNYFDKTFQQCAERDRQTALSYFERKGAPYNGIIGKAEQAYLGRSFFTTLKQYTVEGYCTSQAGATRGLSYLYVPGSYHGCIPLQPGQKTWATR
jgi:hypothetical protein